MHSPISQFRKVQNLAGTVLHHSVVLSRMGPWASFTEPSHPATKSDGDNSNTGSKYISGSKDMTKDQI